MTYVQQRKQLVAHRGRHLSLFDRGDFAAAHYRLPTDGPQVSEEVFGPTCNTLFNGYINNVPELVEAFALPAEAEASDTRCLDTGFGLYGLVFLEQAKGMFAAAYLDGDDLYLFRDTIGIKPLYYVFEKGTLIAFSSEAKGLVGLAEDVNQVAPGELLHFDIQELIQHPAKNFTYKGPDGGTL